jgi:murein DD-endopeptidase MepM/ murein hydrolase activator NlpD
MGRIARNRLRRAHERKHYKTSTLPIAGGPELFQYTRRLQTRTHYEPTTPNKRRCLTTTPLDPTRARLISGYGWRFNHTEFHAGIDLAAAIGEPVRAVRAGYVAVSAPSGALDGYGNVIVVRHASGEATLYAHLNQRNVAPGENVSEGQQIGAVGVTRGTRADPGKVFARSGAHLHFELLAAWPPPGRKQGRLDPTRLWPPAIEGRQPAHPERPAPRPEAPPPTSRSGQGAALALILLLLAAAYARRGP